MVCIPIFIHQLFDLEQSKSKKRSGSNNISAPNIEGTFITSVNTNQKMVKRASVTFMNPLTIAGDSIMGAKNSDLKEIKAHISTSRHMNEQLNGMKRTLQSQMKSLPLLSLVPRPKLQDKTNQVREKRTQMFLDEDEKHRVQLKKIYEKLEKGNKLSKTLIKQRQVKAKVNNQKVVENLQRRKGTSYSSLGAEQREERKLTF